MLLDGIKMCILLTYWWNKVMLLKLLIILFHWFFYQYTDTPHKNTLQAILEEDAFSYTCGMTLDDLDLTEEMKKKQVAVRTHVCDDPVEPLYFSNTENDVICVYCSTLLPDLQWDFKSADCYPKCQTCNNKAPILIKHKK